MRVLLSSIGRRGYLVKFFKEALGKDGQIWGGGHPVGAMLNIGGSATTNICFIVGVNING